MLGEQGAHGLGVQTAPCTWGCHVPSSVHTLQLGDKFSCPLLQGEVHLAQLCMSLNLSETSSLNTTNVKKQSLPIYF